MEVDPEFVNDYLKQPLMKRLTYLLSCSLKEIINKATSGYTVMCSLASLSTDGNMTIYIPAKRISIYSIEEKTVVCTEKSNEGIGIVFKNHLAKNIKRVEKDKEAENLYPIGSVQYLAEIEGERVFWTAISSTKDAPIYSNQLFIGLCDEFVRKWGNFLSKESLKKYKEYWDATSRRVIGMPNLFIEYVASLLLNDHFNLDNFQNDGVNLLVYLNILSSQPYEGRPCKGMLCLLKRNLQNYTMIFSFEKEECILDKPVRENRKLIEMTDDHYALIIEDGNILGIGDRELGDETIRFFGNSNWDFEDHEGNVVFRSETGNIRIAGNKDNSCISMMLEEQFGTDCDKQVVSAIIAVASEQKHGTGIVISNDAEDEAQRLHEAGRDIKIKPIFLGNHIGVIQAITRIDGAMLIDPYGTCYAISAIVDGISVIEGSSSRGARYNSLCNYVAWQQAEKKNKCLAVVISEDGTVDIVMSKQEINERWVANG